MFKILRLFSPASYPLVPSANQWSRWMVQLWLTSGISNPNQTQEGGGREGERDGKSVTETPQDNCYMLKEHLPISR